ncbi:MAG: GNAT family N-acetyltransferase [Oscillospiraceae bacterium]|nr:GNAT family N-acetyltransferase [Oscillospiraceae bacterium]
MTKIYIIRHAEAEGNLYRIVQGQFDSGLTDTGYRQLEFLAERFRGVHLDAIYSSDLRRALSTAEAVAKTQGLEIIKEPRLREICMGVCEGISFGDMEHLDPGAMARFRNDPASWTAEGAEPYAECTRRTLSALRDIAAENEGKTVCAVSHGVSIRAALAELLGIASAGIADTLPHGDNTSVSLLTYDGGELRVEYFNDNSHVPEELSTFAKQTWWKNDAQGRADENLRYEALDPNRDGRLYVRCYGDSWLAAHGSLNGFVSSLYLADAKKLYARDSRAILAAYDSRDNFVGVVETDVFRCKKERCGWISLIYLTPENRGHGLGVQLLGTAVCRCRQLGYKALRLHVSADNKRALAFYNKQGFSVIDTHPGCGAPLYLMEKKLDR